MPAAVPPPQPPLPARALAQQHAQWTELLDAAHDRAVLYARLKDRTVEWYAPPAERPDIEGQEVVAIGIPSFHPRETGAGTWGWSVEVDLAVVLYTRNDTGVTGEHRPWAREHYAKLWLLWNAFTGKMLYSAYNPGTGRPTGRCLTTAPCRPLDGPTFNKATFRQNYGFTELRFVVPTIIPLDRDQQV